MKPVFIIECHARPLLTGSTVLYRGHKALTIKL